MNHLVGVRKCKLPGEAVWCPPFLGGQNKLNMVYLYKGILVLLIYATTWIHFEDMMLRETRQWKRGRCFMIPLLRSTWSSQSTETGKRVMVARAQGSREHGDVCRTLVLPEAKNCKGRFPKVNYRLESDCDGKFYALHILLP